MDNILGKLIARVESEVRTLNGIEVEEAAKVSGRSSELEWRICKAVIRSAPNRARPAKAGQAWRQLAQRAEELGRLYKRMQEPMQGHAAPTRSQQ